MASENLCRLYFTGLVLSGCGSPVETVESDEITVSIQLSQYAVTQDGQMLNDSETLAEIVGADWERFIERADRECDRQPALFGIRPTSMELTAPATVSFETLFSGRVNAFAAAEGAEQTRVVVATTSPVLLGQGPVDMRPANDETSGIEKAVIRSGSFKLGIAAATDRMPGDPFSQKLSLKVSFVAICDSANDDLSFLKVLHSVG